MKLILYLDTYSHQTYFNATNQPGEKLNGWTRYKIEVEIEDVNKPDFELQATALKEQP